MRLLAALLGAVVGFAALAALAGPMQDGPAVLRSPAASSPHVEAFLFESKILDRLMPLTVVLPPGYDDSDDGYPVLYMLHGLSGTNEEWLWYGIDAKASELMASGTMPPLIIALPQGDDGYWMNHADGGPRWGDYVAREVVGEIDRRFRTLPSSASRAVGGLSMGADGALQLALGFPDVFGVAGAHSPVLRAYDIAPSFYGDTVYFAAHSPPSMVRALPAVANGLVLAIDVGESDEWFPNALAFHEELLGLGVRHEWQVFPGIHNNLYWSAHLVDYLRFYAANLAP